MDLIARFTPTGVGTTQEKLNAIYPGQAVHPHRRGDNVIRTGHIDGPVRFTPTGVGTTLASPAWALPPTAVHPHRRGDNDADLLAGAITNSGSPPQAWGQRGALHSN